MDTIQIALHFAKDELERLGVEMQEAEHEIFWEQEGDVHIIVRLRFDVMAHDGDGELYITVVEDNVPVYNEAVGQWATEDILNMFYENVRMAIEP